MSDDFLKECVFRYRCVVLFTLASVFIYWGLDTLAFSVIQTETDWDMAIILICIFLLIIPPLFFGAFGEATVLFIAYLLFEWVVYYPFLFIRFLYRLFCRHLINI